MSNFEMEYEDRCVAFIDILGFKNLIAKSQSNFDQMAPVYDALAILREHTTKPGEQNGSSFIATTFSDNVVISVDANSKDISELFECITTISEKLMEVGILLRGAIVIGKIIHDDKAVFGPALVEAYNLEATKAVQPRVILSPKVIDTLADQSIITEWIVRDLNDGLCFLHTLKTFAREARLPVTEKLEKIKKTKAAISKNLQNILLDAAAYKKFKWLAGYWNASMQNIGNPDIGPFRTIIYGEFINKMGFLGEGSPYTIKGLTTEPITFDGGDY